MLLAFACFSVMLAAAQSGSRTEQSAAMPQALAEASQVLEKHNCAACHGKTGISPNGEWPNLAGRNAELLKFEIREFREGRRTHPLMSPVAKTMSDAEIVAVANYFNEQDPRDPGTSDVRLNPK